MMTSYGPENSEHLERIQLFYGSAAREAAEKSSIIRKNLMKGLEEKPAPKKKGRRKKDEKEGTKSKNKRA